MAVCRQFATAAASTPGCRSHFACDPSAPACRANRYVSSEPNNKDGVPEDGRKERNERKTPNCTPSDYLLYLEELDR